MRARRSCGRALPSLLLFQFLVLFNFWGVIAKVYLPQNVGEQPEHVLVRHESIPPASSSVSEIQYTSTELQGHRCQGAQRCPPSRKLAHHSEHDDPRALPKTNGTLFPRQGNDDDKRDWQAWVSKGKDLLDMLTCGTGPQSKWTSFDDLKTWGWSRKEKKVDYPGFLPKDVPKYLGDTVLADELWEVVDEHTKTTINDDTLYYATDAMYGNFYSSSLIISDTNFGPETEGPSQNPPVDGERYPFPKLGRLSDVLFLEFQERMKVLEKPTNKLKGHLRAGIVNRHTKTIVKKALNDDGKIWPSWPGRDFPPDTEGFSALLASPNGRGMLVDTSHLVEMILR